MHALFLLFTFHRTGRRKLPPAADRGDFVGPIRTSPGIFRLDPKGRKRR